MDYRVTYVYSQDDYVRRCTRLVSSLIARFSFSAERRAPPISLDVTSQFTTDRTRYASHSMSFLLSVLSSRCYRGAFPVTIHDKKRQ